MLFTTAQNEHVTQNAMRNCDHAIKELPPRGRHNKLYCCSIVYTVASPDACSLKAAAQPSINGCGLQPVSSQQAASSI